MTHEQRKQEITEIKKQILILEKRLSTLEHECEHRIIQHKYSPNSPFDGLAVCEICDKYFGWYCPDSPDHKCEYKQADGSYDYDYCIYCGEPEERK
jgi:hypothetical protein